MKVHSDLAALLRTDFDRAYEILLQNGERSLPDRTTGYSEQFYFNVAEAVHVARNRLGEQCMGCRFPHSVAKEFVYKMILESIPEQRELVASSLLEFSKNVGGTALADVISSYSASCSSRATGLCSSGLPQYGSLITIECVGKPS